MELGPEFRDEKLFSYTRNKRVGYLRFFRSFSTLAKMKGGNLNKQLNQIFEYFEGVESIIIDIRFNIGGDDAFSKVVAGRFVGQEKVGFYKQTRKKGEFGDLNTKMLKPSGSQAFTKPVILITNDRSVSAADVLALMMSDLPNVKIIGERSNGSYSDLYGRKLPNGWKVTLSNQRYFSVGKKNYEGIGTPVDYEVKNTIDDIDKKEDSVHIRALELLEKEGE